MDSVTILPRGRDFTELDLAAIPDDGNRDELVDGALLSPSTRHIDLGLERSRYEAAGCASYWVVDPEVPSLTVWELGGAEGYRLAGAVEGVDRLVLERPFPVAVVPAVLVG